MIKPPFAYFGGKGVLAPTLAKMFRQVKHTTYVEPFLGAGSVLLAKDPVHKEYANDAWDLIYETYEAVKEDMDRLLETLNREFGLIHKTTFAKARAVMPDPAADRYLRAAAFIYVNRNSILHTGSSFNLMIPNTGAMQARLNRDLLKRIQHVNFTNVDVHKFLTYFRNYNEKTLVYLDPPYVETSELHSEKVGAVDKFTCGDLEQMLDTLAAAKYRFTLSGFPHPVLDEAVKKHGWDYKEIVMNSGASRMNGGKGKTEVLISNYRMELGKQEELL